MTKDGTVDSFSRNAPVRPTATEIAQAVVEYREGLRHAMRHGFRLDNPEAMQRVGLWLRFLAGEDVSAEVNTDGSKVEPVGICSVCGEPQYATSSGETCSNGHGGVPSLEGK